VLISRLERLGLGVFTRSCPPELVDRLVSEAGRSEKRRRLLSARFTVYFVLGLVWQRILGGFAEPEDE
jgi:hypothetical protein